MNTIFQRAANILQIDENIFWNDKNVEDLQVVYYQKNQEYTPHHDFGADDHHINSRYITILFYLNNQIHPQAGGETWFPKAKLLAGMNDGIQHWKNDDNDIPNDDDDGQVGLKIHAGKGNAVMFYNLLEDGNGDDLTLHAALPVLDGEKWLANFWVWDPHR